MIMDMLIILTVVWAMIVVLYQAETNKLKQIEREKIFQKWMFDSLYSISSKVMLPNEATRETESKAASVYSPEDDPMSEFDGTVDDWFPRGKS